MNSISLCVSSFLGLMLYGLFHHFPLPPTPTVHHLVLQGFLTKHNTLAWTKNTARTKLAIHPLWYSKSVTTVKRKIQGKIFVLGKKEMFSPGSFKKLFCETQNVLNSVLPGSWYNGVLIQCMLILCKAFRWAQCDEQHIKKVLLSIDKEISDM